MKPEISQKIRSIFLRQSGNFKFDWRSEVKNEDGSVCRRIESELLGYGPIENLLQIPEITEVLVNRWDQVFFEKSGTLHQSDDHFYSEQTYDSVLERLAQNCGTYLSREKPFVEAQLQNLRITILFGEISRGSPILSIRIQPQTLWSLSALMQNNFLTNHQLSATKDILTRKKNFIVVGNTGSGKTSFLQALLAELKAERTIIIEDTQELHLPNNISASLLTRNDPGQTVADITMDDLIKRAMRLRPDRLVVGEIRGKEAMSLLLALATGHDGSFGSMHARSAPEALLRLEMLIQMGAPQWSLLSIRKLISMTVQYVFVLEKKAGSRSLKEIFEISSLEETGLTFTQLESEAEHTSVNFISGGAID